MKKLICAVIAAVLLVAPCFASDSAALVIDGSYKSCGVVLIDGTAYIPARAVCDEMGWNIYWQARTKNIMIQSNSFLAVFKDKSTSIFTKYLSGNMPQPSLIRNGVFYIPARGLALALSKTVKWDGNTRRVIIGRDAENTYSESDLYWLSRIISAESRGESLEGQIAVGNVVLNRVKSPDFPNTVYDVIFDKSFGTQFTPVALGTVYDEPSEMSIKAAKNCLNGIKTAENCLYFFNPVTSTAQSWIVENRVFCKKIGNHEFYF